jgi:hypothetical protein
MFNYNMKVSEINPIYGYNKNLEMIKIIETGTLQEFITLAKEYNIFQESKNKFYLSMCEKIKNRLIKENLTENDVRPGD